MSGDYVRAHAERLDRAPGTELAPYAEERLPARQPAEAPLQENGYAYVDGTIFAADPEWSTAGALNAVILCGPIHP